MPLPHPMWQDRLIAAREHVVPWIASYVALTDATVLEYGSGQGAVSCAIAPHVRRHVGLDIDPEALEMARGHLERLGVGNSELVHAPVEHVVQRFRELLPEADVVLLYAVLEHLTLGERLEILTAIREALPPHGVVVVCETPNRLTPFDVHTGQMPFLHQLPVDLARRYASHSPRPDFVDAIAEAAKGGPEAAREAIVRWGQGVSFHEFELVFGDLGPLVVGGGFDAALYPIRPVREEELELSRRLTGWRPGLAPAWSRCWLDVVLRVTPGTPPDPGPVRPWPMRTRQVESGVALLPGPILELAPQARALVRLSRPTRTVHLGARTDRVDGRAVALVVVDGQPLEVELAPARDHDAPWHGTVEFPTARDTFDVELPSGGNVTYVGYAPGA